MTMGNRVAGFGDVRGAAMRTRGARRLMLAGLMAAAFSIGSGRAQVAGSYQMAPILSDGYATAPVVDAGFVDPWGFNNTGTFWINANVTGLSYVSGTNGAVKLKAIVPPASGTSPGSPTGIVKPPAGFVLSNGAAASFVFGTIDGTISGWSGALGGTSPALIMVNNSAANAVYTDIALDPAGAGTVLLAANFGKGGTVEVYDSMFKPTTLPGTFTDPNVPAGYAPYAVHAIGTQVFVTYMLRSTTTYSETLGPNTGFVSVFDVNGNYVQRAIMGGNLNAPWGMALAPATFGVYGGDLLVGNLGDGLINVYDPVSFAYLGQLPDATGKPILNSLPGAGVANTYAGLWEIGFGRGNPSTGSPAVTSAGDPNTLYFAAGLDAESHGLFGAISTVAATGGVTTFGFSASTPALTVVHGKSVSATLAVTPVNGFAGAVTLGCTGLPANSTCSFTPATVTVNSNAPATATVTIATNPGASAALREKGGASTYLALLMLPCGLLLFGAGRKRRGTIAVSLCALFAGAMVASSALSGCGSAAATGTPTGASKVTIVATAGAISQTTTVNLTVQ
jgi:uncharacterized protein (TIGR03118 family)